MGNEMRVLGKDGLAREIRVEDILYFTNHQNTIYVHTRDGEFTLPTTLSDLLAAYRDLGFDRLDRSNVVNLWNIESYDASRRLVKFVDTTDHTTVSEANEKKVKRYLNDRREDP